MEEYVEEKWSEHHIQIMGAIGVGLIAKEQYEKNPKEVSTWDLRDLDTFSYEQQANAPCPFCTNHCQRTIVQFSNGNSWVTNNRCEKGEDHRRSKKWWGWKAVKRNNPKTQSVPDLFQERKKLLFKEYPYPVPKTERDITIGIPRVLSYWDTMPFWTTFFKSLGYKVQLSDESTREIYESGLSAVTSDTVCFQQNLCMDILEIWWKKYHVDRIFMPSITTVPPENMEKTSESMCAVVKGYPIVIRNSDNPQDKWNVPFDAPLFHWHTKKDRQHQW